MKKILFCTAIALISLQACDKSDDDLKDRNVSQQVKQALSAKYPNASRIEWHSRNNYVVADFFDASSNELSAWFDNSGVWYMTETDIRFDLLPQAVKTSFTTGQYASWKVEDVDKIERNAAETVYVIEIENQHSEIDLYYSSNGVLVKEIVDADSDNDYEDYIPTVQPLAIETYLKTNYPNATILEFDREGIYTEVDILDGQVKRELVFDSNNTWVSTQWDIQQSELPQAVKDAITISHASYRIDDIEFHQTLNGEYYNVELEKGNSEVTLKIKVDGTLL